MKKIQTYKKIMIIPITSYSDLDNESIKENLDNCLGFEGTLKSIINVKVNNEWIEWRRFQQKKIFKFKSDIIEIGKLELEINYQPFN